MAQSQSQKIYRVMSSDQHNFEDYPSPGSGVRKEPERIYKVPRDSDFHYPTQVPGVPFTAPRGDPHFPSSYPGMDTYREQGKERVNEFFPIRCFMWHWKSTTFNDDPIWERTEVACADMCSTIHAEFRFSVRQNGIVPYRLQSYLNEKDMSASYPDK